MEVPEIRSAAKVQHPFIGVLSSGELYRFRNEDSQKRSTDWFRKFGFCELCYFHGVCMYIIHTHTKQLTCYNLQGSADSPSMLGKPVQKEARKKHMVLFDDW